MPRLSLHPITYQLKRQSLTRRTIRTVDFAVSQTNEMTDERIIQLTNILMSMGNHRIMVPSLHQGRTMMTTFLQSLNYYTRLGCLSASATPLPELVDDLSYLFEAHDDLDSMITHTFHYELIWIEETPELAQRAQALRTKLKELGMTQSICVVTLCYQITNLE